MSLLFATAMIILLPLIVLHLLRYRVSSQFNNILRHQQGPQVSSQLVSLLNRVAKMSSIHAIRHFLLHDVYLEYPELKTLIQRYGFTQGVELACTFEVFELEKRLHTSLSEDQSDGASSP